MTLRALLLAALGWLMAAGAAAPHALEPAYLSLSPLGGDRMSVVWTRPVVEGAPMRIEAVLPETCAPRRPPGEPRWTGRAYETRWVAECPGGLAGGEIRIDGLEATQTDTLARIETGGGGVATLNLTAADPAAEIPADPGFLDVAKTYTLLGVEHILSGFDHLLFVLALLLLIRGTRLLIETVTAFTVAHSITLSLAALGFVSVPGPPVEAAIALSIAFLATELVRVGAGGPPLLAERRPWLVAFAFGLLHGLGFAGALAEIGLPQGDIPAALFSFNVGVEIGQLLFIACALVIRRALRTLAEQAGLGERARAAALTATAYGIGAISCHWMIVRVAGFWA